MADMFDLTGRRAVVTGGSRGLGRRIVLAYASHGADVAIVSRRLESCEELAREVVARYGVEAVPIACNVSDWESCDALFDEIDGLWGGADILVNNAGMSPLYDVVTDITEALWDKVLAVNLKGPFRLSALFGRDMQERGGGSILNISSLAAIRATPDVVPYAAAKAGINNLTQSLAAAFGPNVRVNTIMPGRFATDISQHWDWDVVRDEVRVHALQRVAEPHEIEGAALYFASDASSFATGAVLRLDGGVP